MADHVISQKRMAHRTRFEFRDRSVGVHVEDNQAAVSFDQPYEEIPFETRSFTEKMMALRGAAIFLCLFASYQIFSYFLLEANVGALIAAGIQLAIAGLAEFGFRRSNVTFTMIDASRGTIFVIDDKAGPDILARIAERRRAALRSAAGEINFENPIDIEVEKFNWLREHDVITAEEHQQKLSALGKLSAANETPDPKRLH
ncbi:MAG: hypothetical protein AAF830_01165 [Pseudomonadota bacterium]